MGAVNQGDDAVALDEQHEHDHQGDGQQPAAGVLGQLGDFAAVHLPELNEEREQDALEEQAGDYGRKAVH